MINTGEKNELIFSRRRLSALIIPLILEQLLSVLVGMIDVVMVSFIGEAAVSGVSLVDSITNLIIQILFAVTSSGTIICAFYIGRKDSETARKTGGQLIMMTVLTMTVISGIFIMPGGSMLGVLFSKADHDVMENASQYLFITAFSYPFLAIFYSIAALFRARGRSSIPMGAAAFMNVINIAGNAVCIFVLGMGVDGVAIPTVISRLAAAAVMVVIMQSRRNDFRLDKVSQFRPDKFIIRKILFIGIPTAMESSLFNFGKILLQSLVSTMGTASIAAYAVAANLVTYLYLPGNALGIAMGTVVGQCRGAGHLDQAKHYAVVLTGINYVMAAILSLILFAGRGCWIGLYHLSAEAFVLTDGLLTAHCVMMAVWPIAFLLPYYYRALGFATRTMVIAAAAMIVFRIGFAYLFVVVLGKDVLWVWYAMFLDWIFRAIVYGHWFSTQ